MRYSPLVGVLGTFIVVAATMGEYGCSTSTALPGPPVSNSADGGAGGAPTATGGVTATTTTASVGGTTSATGGAPSATGGATSCAPNQSKCTGVCVDLSSDPLNCGTCGTACFATQVCSSGQCVCPTDNPDLCGTRCVNLQNTTTDCGACYKGCSPMRCIAGSCACATTDITCSTAAGQACFDGMSDPQQLRQLRHCMRPIRFMHQRAMRS